MNRTVLVLGADHRYQTLDPAFTEAQHDTFAQLIVETCRTYSIRAIAEEHNTQALEEVNLKESVPHRIARILGLMHQYCDPDRAIRRELGILQENDIRAGAFLQHWSETVVQEKLRGSHRERESYWIRQILALNFWPVLFICGSDHSLSLLSLLSEYNLQAELVADDWGA